MRRRSAIEPIIGHLKAEGHLGRCYLKGRTGDAANVVLSAVGHNIRRILAPVAAMFEFTNRQAVVFCIVMLFAAALTFWGVHYVVYNWWLPPLK